MMKSNMKVIIDQLENLTGYLQPFLSLANFHMVDYFSKEAFEKHIPKEIQLEINEMGQEDVINSIFRNNYKNLPKLGMYFEKSNELTLKNCSICLQSDEFQEKLSDWGCKQFSKLKLDIFMTSKKSHEVEILSTTAAAIKNISKTSHLIDIGDGKGYLSSMLALHHKIPVLGVDASEVNTNGAVKRVQKLSRLWNSVVKGNEEKTSKTTPELYKQITKFVHQNINFNDLISAIFLEEPNGLGLVGLHTCGNLAATSIRIFNSNEHIKTICNVGCCYHFITEAFEHNQQENHLVSSGFPMSEYLRRKKFVIGRAARMIAAQSVERILHKKDLPNNTIFYRALFEVFLERKCSDLASEKRQVGRLRKECVNFREYVQKAAQRINLDLKICDSEIENLYDEYRNRVNELNIFYLIRCMLAPVIESLILLDRLLFLHEQGHENSFLVQLFDPLLSPRCYGVIAIKK